jgi:hypothetical protein
VASTLISDIWNPDIPANAGIIGFGLNSAIQTSLLNAVNQVYSFFVQMTNFNSLASFADSSYVAISTTNSITLNPTSDQIS